ncbi:DUF2917 domain-containing protein [Paraburkholderia ferrariae]|uniref:DUF2917 domain-containing protein n=1 Tax=Paraburkholderia ferrariae TaxID=386056 RepID=UPI000A069FE6|nr:DUF2917 domain-containing protein [Paraburkholderia ferrariae]
MDDASQQAASRYSRSLARLGAQRSRGGAQPTRHPHVNGTTPGNRDHELHDAPLPAQSLHFAVPQGQTFTWRLAADSLLRVYGAQIWVTRARSPYDHWLNPGDTLRLTRGERIWLSTETDTPARVTLTSEWRPRSALLRRAFLRLAAWPFLLARGR